MTKTTISRKFIIAAFGLLALLTFSLFYWQSDNVWLKNAPQRLLCVTTDLCRSNWKTFTSDNKDISFMYPGTLVAFEVPDQNLQYGQVYKMYTSQVNVSRPQANLKDYNYKGPRNWLELTISTHPSNYAKVGTYNIADPSFHQLKANEAIVRSVKVSGHALKLIQQNLSDSSSYIRLAQCDPDNSCSSAIKQVNGTYLSASLDFTGEVYPSPKFDFNSDEYKQLIEILKTLKLQL